MGRTYCFRTFIITRVNFLSTLHIFVWFVEMRTEKIMSKLEKIIRESFLALFSLEEENEWKISRKILWIPFLEKDKRKGF
jgi:hypothetical protein